MKIYTEMYIKSLKMFIISLDVSITDNVNMYIVQRLYIKINNFIYFWKMCYNNL